VCYEFKVIKIKVSNEIITDVIRIKIIRNAVGNTIVLRLDRILPGLN